MDVLLRDIFDYVQREDGGDVATYIPALAKQNPELFGVSVMTVDGLVYDFGDTGTPFCLQSTSKPLAYCVARSQHDKKWVHEHVGYEPSGRAFNEHCLDNKGRPHNPLINSGAIMTASLISQGEEPASRFEAFRSMVSALSGGIGGAVGFDNSTYLSENTHADRNRSLAYYMRETGAFPPGTDVEETLRLYFNFCSVTVTTKTLASVAATIANQGVSPASQERVLTSEVVRDVSSLMFSCGLYDESGAWAFEIGIPAKSGVSGALMAVIPGKLGVCIFSPRLNAQGNSVRGVEFCRRLVKGMDHHIFTRAVAKESHASDPEMLVQQLISAAARGDSDTVERLLDNVDGTKADYDGRTPLHLACAEGHLQVIGVLIGAVGAGAMHAKDRFGTTPIDEMAKAVACGKMNAEAQDQFLMDAYEKQHGDNS